MRTRRIVHCVAAVAASFPLSAHAAVPQVIGNSVANGILSTIIYGLVGIILAVVAIKVIDVITPGHLYKQLTEDKNVALAIVVGGLILGICIIIAAAIAG